MNRFRFCPRCGVRAYEKLKSHGYCFDCNFNSEDGFSWGEDGRISKNHYYEKGDPTECDEESLDDDGTSIEDLDDDIGRDESSNNIDPDDFDESA